MLVLSRREDDKIVFPNLGIRVQVLRIAGGKVRIGVDAPPEIKVLRHELHEQIQRGAKRRVAEPPAPTESFRDAKVRRHLEAAARSLDELHQLGVLDASRESESLIFEVFSHLKAIDEQAVDADHPPVLQEQGRRSALLVEDNRNERELLASYLRLKQFDVAVAEDGVAALDYLSHHENPDVVLLDMQMPGMDGATTVQNMRNEERYRDLKVYAVSGGDPADYGVEISPGGVNGWFPKPLDPETVVFRLAFENGKRGHADRAPASAVGT